MDLNATATPNPIPNTFPLPPPGLNYIAAIQPSIVFLMIGTAWSGILLPLLVAVFFFSTKDSRRKPIFIMNVVSIALGLIMGIYNGILEIHAILSPLQPFPPTNFMAFAVFTSFTPWLVEMILLVRLTAVYPFLQTPKRLWFSIFIPLALLKLARLVNNIVFVVQYVEYLQGPGAGNPITNAQKAWDSHPGTKIEWILQVIDNAANSALFINRLKSGLGEPERPTFSNSNRTSYTTRIRGLFWIASSNFVFPVILSVVQLIMLFHDPNFLKGTYIFVINDYVEIVGVLMATLWASANHWTDQSFPTQVRSDRHYGSGPHFAIGPYTRGGSSEDTATMKTRTRTKSDGVIELGHMRSQSEPAEVEKILISD